MRAGRGYPTWLGWMGLIVVLVSGWGCSPQPAVDAPASPDTGAFLNHAPEAAYVGMAECKECHLGIHATYQDTGMGRAFYPMTADEVVEDFTVNNSFSVESGLHYRMVERNGQYFQQQFLLDSQGAELALEEREMLFVIGSNNHARSYVTMIGKKWFQAPVCWYPQETKWELCPGFEHKNEHFGREIATNCITCHNGRMEVVQGERNEFHEPYPHGIGCERCHGPGQLHVERWRKPGETATGDLDPTIVNPRRLSVERRMEVCSQCHLGDARATTTVARYGVDTEAYRPGQPREDYLMTFRYAQKTQWDFGLSSQVDRLMLSKCHEASGGKLECLTCHNPHISTYSEDRPKDFFRRKCLSCHQPDHCSEDMTARGQTATPDDCVACHMRTAEPDDQRFTEFTDHWIRKDIALEQRDHRDDYTVEPFFPEQLARVPRGEREYYVGRGYFLLAQDAPKSRYAEMWARAEEAFRAALDGGFDEDDAWFFLGKTLTYQGRHAEARQAYEAAVQRNPHHHDANFALGKAMAEAGEWAAADRVFQKMLELDADNVMALSEFGRSQFSQRRYADAFAALQRSVAAEPWDPTLQINVGMSLAALGRMEEAAQAGDRAVRLNPERLEAWQLFANAMREAGRVKESQEGQRQILRLQRSGNRGGGTGANH